MVWIAGLILLAIALGLGIWVYDPAYRLAWRGRQRHDAPDERAEAEDRALNEPPSS